MTSHDRKPGTARFPPPFWAQPETPYPSLPGAPEGLASGPLRVAIVLSENAGKPETGDMGPFLAGLSRALADGGHRVTVVLLPRAERFTAGFVSPWESFARNIGANLAVLADDDQEMVAYYSRMVVNAYRLYQWLKRNPVDVVHSPDFDGLTYYALLAKRQGLACRDMYFAISQFSQREWLREGTGDPYDGMQDLCTDHMERMCIELCDALISANQFGLWRLLENGWRLPKSVYCSPYVLDLPRDGAGQGQGESETPETSPTTEVQELVYAAPITRKDGLPIFLKALTNPASTKQGSTNQGLTKSVSSKFQDIPVTIFHMEGLGAPVDLAAESVSGEAGWRGSWRIVSGEPLAKVMAYLQQPGKLAVFPATHSAHSPALAGCLLLGIPVLAARAGGNPEMIHVDDRESVLFEPNAKALAGLIASAMANGIKPARPAPSMLFAAQTWRDWHGCLLESTANGPAGEDLTGTDSKDSKPLVSICLVHHNRPLLLQRAIRSIERQDYAPFEVVLVDDGSDDPAAIATLDRLAPQFEAKNWRLIRQSNRYLGAARNTAVRHARGEYILFMDDDNVAKPEELSTFVRAALNSGADILTCASEIFSGDEWDPAQNEPDAVIWVPPGGGTVAGLFHNVYGDANALIRKDVFEKIGGFSEISGLGFEDWEFFAKAALAGFRIQVVPEPLFWYRKSTGSMLAETSTIWNLRRVTRLFAGIDPATLEALLLFSQDMENLHRHTQNVRAEAARLIEENAVVQDQLLRIRRWGLYKIARKIFHTCRSAVDFLRHK